VMLLPCVRDEHQVTQWLQLRFDFDLTAIRPRDVRSTAYVRHDCSFSWAAALRPK